MTALNHFNILNKEWCMVHVFIKVNLQFRFFLYLFQFVLFRVFYTRYWNGYLNFFVLSYRQFLCQQVNLNLHWIFCFIACKENFKNFHLLL